jgi:hypothetical protein
MKWAVVVAYVAFALSYNALIPIGEAPDEFAHWEYLDVVERDGRLPEAADALWQGHQAPLYYIAAAVWSRLVQAVSGCRVDREALPGRLNPGFPYAPNFNRLVHPPSERVTAWGCPQLSFHLLRLFSTALTVPTILLIFGILRAAAPGDPVIAAVGGTLAGLLPSHVVLSAMLNNDALANLLIVAATYCAVASCRTGSPAELAKAALVASLATAAKLSGLYLFGVVLATAAVCPHLRARLRQRDRRWPVGAIAAACCLPVAFVLARNLGQWGDPFAVRALEVNLAKLLPRYAPSPLPSMAHYYGIELPKLFANQFFVAYGAINFSYGGSFQGVRAIPPLIAASFALSAFSRGVWRRVDGRAFVVLAVGFALFSATYFFPGYRYRWLQVRYFFSQLPFLSFVSAIGVVTAWRGLSRLDLPISERALVALLYLGLVALNAIVLTQGVLGHLYRYIGIEG